MKKQSGNVLFYILIAIFLLGSLTVALRSSGDMEGGIDKESASVKAQQIIRYGAEVAQAVQIILDNGASETDIRFSHPNAAPAQGDITVTPNFQVFSSQGGKALYRNFVGVTSGSLQVAGGSARSLPQVGSDKDELYLAIWPINDNICQAINTQLGLSSVPTVDCGEGNVFSGSFTSSSTILNTSAFPSLPAPEFCSVCSNLGHTVYFKTLIAR